MGPSAEDREPPHLVVRLRKGIDRLCAGRDDVVVDHHVEVSGAGGSADQLFWTTTLRPVGMGSPVWILVDDLDRDVIALIRDRHSFEWQELGDEEAVLVDIVGLCASVLAGDLWEWRGPSRTGCEVTMPGGRVMTATRGRLVPVPWANRARTRHRLPGYGLTGPGRARGG
jgi:hypothetical protein